MIPIHVNKFTYRGVSSADMGLIITGTPHIVSPERDVEFISVPGRSGDVIKDNRRFKNTPITYPVSLITDGEPIELMASKIKAWLQSEVGYFRLEDTYDPLYYRMAAYNGSLDIEDKARKIGITSISFNCKPFKYRHDGDRLTEIAQATTIKNPEAWESLPHITIYGSGAVTLLVNNRSFYISDINEYIEIDSELQSAFKGMTLQNDKINFSEFPSFKAGKNTLSWVGDVSKVIIKPRWCCI